MSVYKPLPTVNKGCRQTFFIVISTKESDKMNGSRWLLALSLGINCCFSGSPAIAQLSDLAPAERIEEISDRESRSRLYSLTTECETASVPSTSDLAVIRSALSLAETKVQQIEDIEQQASAFPRMGKSYACIGQVESAKVWLEQSLSLEAAYSDESTPLGFPYEKSRRLIEIATIYSNLLGEAEQAQWLLAQAEASISTPRNFSGTQEMQLNIAELYGDTGDVERMNTIISEVVDSVEIETDQQDDAHYRYIPLETGARLYAKFGQYQQLRQLLARVAVDYVREDSRAVFASSQLFCR